MFHGLVRRRHFADLTITLKVFLAPGLILAVMLGLVLVAVSMLTADKTRLREIGVSERMVEGERDAWILLAARWPDRVREWMPGKLAELDDPQLVRLYRLGSEFLETDADDDSRLEEAADILAGLLERADASGFSILTFNGGFDHRGRDDAAVFECQQRCVQRGVFDLTTGHDAARCRFFKQTKIDTVRSRQV